jgi:polyphosphate kinase 2 (PPK2 family)
MSFIGMRPERKANMLMAAFNPAGCRVESFKVPNPVELAHDFLWRVHRVTPAKGVITIFNRSHYEDVLAARVHELVPRRMWERRYRHITDFEALLVEDGPIILRFFLYISKQEQKARQQDSDRAWKLCAAGAARRFHHTLQDKVVLRQTPAINPSCPCKVSGSSRARRTKVGLHLS